MLQCLPRISQPNGAVAILNQASKNEPIPAPRGMTLDPRQVQKRTRKVPADTAAMHLHPLYRGYMATRTVVACEHIAELPMLLNSENEELKHAAEKLVPPDESLPPRPVAVTLLAWGTQEVHCIGARTFLDSLAHLASSPMAPDSGQHALTASLVRMTVLAGVDAAWYAEQVKGQALDSAPDSETAMVQLCVRWAVRSESGQVQYRAEFKTMHSSTTLDVALESMQNWFISLKMVYNVPFQHGITTRHPNVPVNAWAHSVHNASNAFFALMEGTQSVKKSAMVECNKDLHMEHTGVHVRICQKNTYMKSTNQWIPLPLEEAARMMNCFHGFVIGNQSKLSEIHRYCKHHEQWGLPPPSEDTAAYCLHTVAVQATGFPLKQRVTLYAVHWRAGGMKPGVPICSPGSWIWRYEPAIVPLEDVLRNFYVVPCNRDSLLPGDPKLVRAFGQFFDRSYRLYTDTFGDIQCMMSGDEFERLPLTLPSLPASHDPQLESEEKYALTAFGLDAASKRVVVGDAYAMLKANRAPPELAEFMLQSTLRMGLNTSVIDAMANASRLMKTGSTNAESKAVLSAEVERLKRVADAALMLEVAKRPKHLSPGIAIDSSKVRSLMKAAGLVQGTDAILPTWSLAGPEQYSVLVQTLSASIVGGGTTSETHIQACRIAATMHNKGPLQCIGSTICVLRASPHSSPCTVFIVAQTDGQDGVSFNRVLPDGGYEAARPGELIDTPVSAVFLLKVHSNGSARMTSTIRV